MKVLAAVAMGAMLLPSAARPQEKYPERPIRLLSPFAPGASTDAAARRFAVALTPLIGQSVYVDNRAGGAGSIAAAEVARAKPDGYTLIFGTVSTHVLNVLTMKNVSYDPLKDFANIALLGTNTSSLAVHPTIATTLPELIQRVKSMPGKFSYGSSGQGSILHLAGELFKQQAGGLDMMPAVNPFVLRSHSVSKHERRLPFTLRTTYGRLLNSAFGSIACMPFTPSTTCVTCRSIDALIST